MALRVYTMCSKIMRGRLHIEGRHNSVLLSTILRVFCNDELLGNGQNLLQTAGIWTGHDKPSNIKNSGRYDLVTP